MYEQCLGWKGLLIEANPHHYKLLKMSGRTTPMIHGAVCSKQDGYIAFQEGLGGATHQFFDRQSTNVQQHKVPCKPLSEYLDEYGIHRLNVFHLDCEGAEGIVMQHSPLHRIDMISAEVLPEGLSHTSFVPKDRALTNQMDSIARVATRLKPAPSLHSCLAPPGRRPHYLYATGAHLKAVHTLVTPWCRVILTAASHGLPCRERACTCRTSCGSSGDVFMSKMAWWRCRCHACPGKTIRPLAHTTKQTSLGTSPKIRLPLSAR